MTNTTFLGALAGGLILIISLLPKDGMTIDLNNKIYVPGEGGSSNLLKTPNLSWEKITEHYTPAKGIEDWQKLVKKRHWKKGFSAYETANSWHNANPDLPQEIQALFGDSAELLVAIPEHETSLEGGRRGSISDALAFIEINGNVCAVAIEGKKDEGFGKPISKEFENASSGKTKRLEYISETLGLDYPPADNIHYQLLHRAAAAVIEAERFNAECAALVVHSFSQTQKSFSDYGRFLGLFGVGSVGPDNLYTTHKPGIPLSFGWASSQRTGVPPAQTTEPGFSIGMGWLAALAVGLILVVGFGLKSKAKNRNAKMERQAETAPVETPAKADETPPYIHQINEQLERLNKAIEKGAQANEVDENKLNGDKFEKYVVSKFNVKGKRFRLKDWAGDKYHEGIYAETTQEPDLKLALNAAGKEWPFAVECKWRNGFNRGKVKIANGKAQLENYQNYGKRTNQKTFVALGLGAPSDNPPRVFVVPLENMTRFELTEKELAPYEQKNKGRFFYDYRKKTLGFMRRRH